MLDASTCSKHGIWNNGIFGGGGVGMAEVGAGVWGEGGSIGAPVCPRHEAQNFQPHALLQCSACHL